MAQRVNGHLLSRSISWGRQARVSKFAVLGFFVLIILANGTPYVGLSHGSLAKFATTTNYGKPKGPGTLPEADEVGLRRDQVTDNRESYRADRPQCYLVHRAQDQCAFINAYCADTEPGLFSYLSLYYCRLSHARVLAFTILLAWLAFLFMTVGIAASDFFCVNLSTIATVWGMSENMAGVTLLALGNGSPDVFSTFAAMGSGSGSLALGELIGAASFITAVVVGSMALVQPFEVARSNFVRDVGFFIIAISFSMVFLADGRLQTWECAVMIGLYILYVGLVLIWHWKIDGRKRTPSDQSAEEQGLAAAVAAAAVAAATNGSAQGSRPDSWPSYHEPIKDDELNSPRHYTTRPHSASSGSRPNPLIRLIGDETEEPREVSMAAVKDGMHVSRGHREWRRPILSTIRPSLIGALEFWASITVLEKFDMHDSARRISRRHTYDLGCSRPIPHSQLSIASDPQVHTSDHRTLAQNGLGDHSVFWNGPSLDVGHSRGRVASDPEVSVQILGSRSQASGSRSSSPSISVSSPTSGQAFAPGRSERSASATSSTHLLVPSTEQFLAVPNSGQQSRMDHRQPSLSAGSGMKPNLSSLEIPQDDGLGNSQLLSPVARFTDSPMPLSPPRSPQLLATHIQSSVLPFGDVDSDSVRRPKVVCRPSASFPSFHTVVSTLYPTLRNWNHKSIWGRVLGVVAAPSVFLLVITLPVAELVEDDPLNNQDSSAGPVLFSAKNPRGTGSSNVKPAVTTNERANVPKKTPHEPANGDQSHQPLLGHPNDRSYGGLGSLVADVIEQAGSSPNTNGLWNHGNSTDSLRGSPDQHPSMKAWNRWLVCVQIIVAPIFVAIIIWANVASDPVNLKALWRAVVYTFVGSLFVLLLFLASTNSKGPPRHYYLLCFVGFIVSIAWISTIATEVVGVLKALGVILGISDAILGLTIFAVGNSLGDLVSDITVARLGYQVMALSACFGGPLLNILLGIGVGGLYKTIHNNPGRHPHKGLDGYQPYEIKISSTLIISGSTLLITLIGLLVFVPLNGWQLDRKLGLGLVSLWSISTVSNLIMEVVGWGE